MFNGTLGFLIFFGVDMCCCTKATWEFEVVSSIVSHELIRGKAVAQSIYGPAVRLLKLV